MMRVMPRLVLALFCTLLCVSATAAQPPPPGSATPPVGVPDLRGSWTGTWGGQPLGLLITEQGELVGSSGVYWGTTQIFGHRQPGLAGIMTYTSQGRPVSVSVQGWVYYAQPRPVLVLRSETPDGPQALTLTRVEEQHLAGSGSSHFRWGPQGAVDLARRARP
jgi:hypothetical protein